ncbi:MAG: ADP-glyceromanno-heptose 6-epimerase [Candidatus Methylacidiphilales bacterium]
MKSILVTGGAGFIGSNLTMELQHRHPDAWITVLDDFRSGDFKNLKGFRGDVVAVDLAQIDLEAQFGEPEFDAVFHMASITDTRELDQQLQIHDNVEGFRNLLEYLSPVQCPLVYASSAATYGISSGINRITDTPAPANPYAFSKAILDNLAARFKSLYPFWKITGLKFFNVYGPHEAHKGVPASMIYHLAQQMRKGQPPRIFKMGEQMRDFVYVKDIVTYTLRAMEVPQSALLNAGSGQPRSFNDLVSILNTVLNTQLEPEYIENPFAFYQPHTEADISLTREVLGIGPAFTLETGIQDYFESGHLLP